jgi:hypothetical protein
MGNQPAGNCRNDARASSSSPFRRRGVAVRVSASLRWKDKTTRTRSSTKIRKHIDQWRDLPPRQWGVTPETQRLLLHWRDPLSRAQAVLLPVVGRNKRSALRRRFYSPENDLRSLAPCQGSSHAAGTLIARAVQIRGGGAMRRHQKPAPRKIIGGHWPRYER